MTNQALVAINQLPPTKIASDDRVSKKFVEIYNIVHGKKDGQMIHATESFHFQKQVSENANLQTCTPLSLYGAFMDVAVQGLSFDPSKKLCYLVPYSVNAGTKDSPKWEKRAMLQISPYGELALRQNCGQVARVDNPMMVFEGEDFELNSSDAGKMIKHTIKYPRPEKPIACYIKIVKPDDNIDYFVLDLPGMQRLAEFSAKKNNGKANALYTSNKGLPDIGFWQGKTIKHAFMAYPKIKLRGNNTVLETEAEELPEEINYSINDEPEDHIATAIPVSEVRNTPTPPPTQATIIMTAPDEEQNSMNTPSNQPVIEEEGY